MPNSARVLIEVNAGLVPDQPVDEYRRAFTITSQEWGKDGLEGLLRLIAEANAYVLYLQINSATGRAPNWIRTDYTWL